MTAGHPAPPQRARVAAVAALAGFLLSLAALVTLLVRHPLELVGALVAWGFGMPAAWAAVTRRRHRVPLGVLAAILFLGGLVLLAGARSLFTLVAVALGFAVTAALGAAAMQWEVGHAVSARWKAVPAAARPVLLMNPKSGDGKVDRFHLVDEARRRGIEGIVLGPGDDLPALAESAARGGADVIGMAGGDGSQALVASVAASHGVAFVCIPAGTRNHLALDLGVDRDDVVGSLDAFGPAREARIDLATVNGRVFVNNVSLGVYAEIVRSDAYRDAKLKTVSEMLPELLGTDAERFDLAVHQPAGPPIDSVDLVQVSNNPYVLDRLGGFGTRSRLDTGMLGVATLHIGVPADLTKFVTLEAIGRLSQFAGWREWTTAALQVDSDAAVAAAVDGESLTLAPPLRFEILPGAVRVRTAPHHPGVSPATTHQGLGRSSLLGLAAIAGGRPSGLIDVGTAT